MSQRDISSNPDRAWNQETGAPELWYLGNAIQVWASLQKREVTVNEAALAFNLTPNVIRAAIEDHYWMYLAGDVIEHDGE